MDPEKLPGNEPWITKEGILRSDEVPHRQCSETGPFR